MYRFTIVLLILFCFTPMVSAQECLESRLIIGDYARVTPGGSNNLRDSASPSGGLVDTIPEGHVVTVLDNPICNDGLMWANVEYDISVNEKVTGWTVESINGEYALEPFPVLFENTVGYPHITLSIPDLSVLETLQQGVYGPAYWNALSYEPATEHHLQFHLDSVGSFRVSPVSSREARENLYGRSLDGLQTVIQRYRDGESQSAADIYDALVVGDEIGFFARPRFIEFEGGMGVRYLAYFQGASRSTYPIRDRDLYYLFQGLSDDGLYYIRSSHGITAPELLPRYEWKQLRDAYRGHVNEVRGIVESADSTIFEPPLAQIDSILTSMVITGGHNTYEVKFDKLNAIAEAPDTGIVDETGYVCGLEPRLEVGGLARQALDTDSLRVRDVADGVATEFNVFPGEMVRVLEGPECVRGRSWWRVEAEDGSWNGWVAEHNDNDYFFEPAE